MTEQERVEYLQKLDVSEVGVNLLNRFWELYADNEEVRASIYWLATFIGWLDANGMGITPIEFITDKDT